MPSAKRRAVKPPPQIINGNNEKGERKNLGPSGGSIWSLVARRVAISASIMLVIYLYQQQQQLNKNSYHAMASAKDNIVGSPLGHQISCSDHYRREQKLHPKCVPQKCGRLVGDSIVTEQEAMELRILAETVFSLARPSGGVAIFDLSSGALSNGTQFIDLYQIIKLKNSKLIKQKTLDTFRTVKNKILHHISLHFGASPGEIHLTSPLFFTKITNAKHQTLNDQYWHPHVDKVTYGSFVYTSLLYLSTYGEDFSGGRFIFLDSNRNITIEPKFGRVSAFTSAEENSHMVEPVQSGVRMALTIPFTCDPKKGIKDPQV